MLEVWSRLAGLAFDGKAGSNSRLFSQTPKRVFRVCFEGGFCFENTVRNTDGSCVEPVILLRDRFYESKGLVQLALFREDS